MDWSPLSNKIAIGLSNSVYIWDNFTQRASFLFEFGKYQDLCSLKWSPSGDHLALGMGSGEIKLWDVSVNQFQSSLQSPSRVGCLDWGQNGLFSGSNHSGVQMFDARSNQQTGQFIGHTKQVLNVKCGLFQQPLVLSGGNDSQVLLFDHRKQSQPVFQKSHEGPIRAIDWSPHKKNQFASGGGSSDQMLKIWDISKRVLNNQILVGSQVCDLKFSELDNEIVIGRGDDSISVYNSRNLKKVGNLEGHSGRVLSLGFSADATELVSVSPDNTMCFWEYSRLTRPRSKGNPQKLRFSDLLASNVE